MKNNKTLKGDRVKVRRHDGSVAEAIYQQPSVLPKCHLVHVGEERLVALGGRFLGPIRDMLDTECRFIGPTPAMEVKL